MTTPTLGDLLALADRLCRELRDSPNPVPGKAWESCDATAYLLMRELVGPPRTRSRAFALSHAMLCRVLDAYPAPLLGARNGLVGAREAAHVLGRPRSTIITKIRKGQIPATWDGRQYLVDATSLSSRDDVRPADPLSPEPLSRLSCTLGVAADLIVRNRDELTRDVDPAVESVNAATATALTHVLGITHVMASHAVKVGPPSGVDRPLAVARFSAAALDALGVTRHGSPEVGTASCAPQPKPVSLNLNERLEFGLHTWATEARSEFNRTVPSTYVIRNVMNQGVHLYAVSARLLEAADGDEADGRARASLLTAMQTIAKADRLWASVTTAMPPSHEYVAAATELHLALTDATRAGAHAGDIDETLDIGAALVDLCQGARDLADLLRDLQHIHDELLRSGLLFAPANR